MSLNTLYRRLQTQQSINEQEDDISNFEQEYQDVLNEGIAIGGILPTIADQRLQNDIMITAKAQGLITNSYSFHYFKGTGDFIFQSINWGDPTGVKATQVGTGDLIVGSTGLTGDDDNYFDTNIVPTYTNHDSSIIWRTEATATGGTALIEANDSGARSTKIVEQSTFQYINTDGTTTNRFITGFNSVGTHIITIDTANEIDISVDAGSVTTNAKDSTTVPTDTYTLFKNGSASRGTSKIGYLIIGDAVNDNETNVVNALDNAPAVTTTGGIQSDGYIPLVLSGNYGTYDAPSQTFTFDKTTALITEGVVVSTIAKNNRDIISEAIRVAVETHSAIIFDFGNVDCYVDTGASQFREQTRVNSIQCSYDNLEIKGTKANTILRMQPHGLIAGAIFNVYKATNMSFTDITLMGEKFEHDYSVAGDGNPLHEFPAGIVLEGAPDCVIQDMWIENFTGDCITVYHSESRQNDGTPTPGSVITTNLLIDNCDLIASRRNNISYVDCDGFVLENSRLSRAGEGGEYDAGQEGYSWKGVLPRCNIDFEATRNRGENCELEEGQKVLNGIVRNNTFTTAWISDLNFYTCTDLEVHNNTFTSSLSVPVWSQRLHIHNNTSVWDNTQSTFSVGIDLKHYTNNCILVNENGDHDVHDNTITGFTTGIKVTDDDSQVYDNTIIDSIQTGLIISGINTLCTNNDISSNVALSIGIDTPSGGSSPDNVQVIGGTVGGQQYGGRIRDISGVNGGVVFNNITFNDDVRVQNSDTASILNCTYPAYSESNSSNIIVSP